jgi:CDGSH-type Zn-finger protein
MRRLRPYLVHAAKFSRPARLLGRTKRPSCPARPNPIASFREPNRAPDGAETTGGGSEMSDDAVVAQTGPYQVDLTEGQEYWYCRCGRSKTQPFCDGSHEGTTFEPLRLVAERTGTYNLCGCKATDDEPFCDGTHNML